MHVPTEEEMAAIAVAFLALHREATAPAAPMPKWRAAARALPVREPRRTSWRDANRVS
jgi:hypothetical protein